MPETPPGCLGTMPTVCYDSITHWTMLGEMVARFRHPKPMVSLVLVAASSSDQRRVRTPEANSLVPSEVTDSFRSGLVLRVTFAAGPVEGEQQTSLWCQQSRIRHSMCHSYRSPRRRVAPRTKR